jgi:hypothetical protein
MIGYGWHFYRWLVNLMSCKNTLLPSLVVILIIGILTGPALAAFTAEDNSARDFKTAVMDGYLQRCVEVLSSKGYSSDAIKAECSCELDQIDQHFAVFENMLSTTQVAPDKQLQINNFKKRLLQCKTNTAEHRPPAG